jgi:subtilisin family serine protease
VSRWLLVLCVFVFSFNSWACPDERIEDDYFRVVYFCDSADNIERVEYRFLKTETPSTIRYYENNQLSKVETFNIDFEMTSTRYFSYENLSWGDFISYRKNDEGVVISQAERKGDPLSFDSVPVREWLMTSDGIIKEIHYFSQEDDQREVARDIFNITSGNLDYTYRFLYFSDKKYDRSLEEVVVLNSKGEHLVTYRPELSQDQINQLLERGNNRSLRLAIIDTGVDFWNSKELFNKVYVNTDESIDGSDTDQNGIIDDVAGFLAEPTPYVLKTNYLDLMNALHSGAPISHGTHVTSIALKDTEDSSFIPFGGDFSSVPYLEWIRDTLLTTEIMFSNMSFGFGDEKDPFAPDSESFWALTDLIKKTPEVTHFVAAGNSGLNLDVSRHKEFPACLKAENLVTVGALKASDLDETQLDSYEIVDFSNYGILCVDILAPGDDVMGDNFGGLRIPLSGTSMASPWAANIAVKVAEAYPSLTAKEIQAILMFTAYVPAEKPFPVRSGGIIFPSRALYAAGLYKETGSMRLAVELARKNLEGPGDTTDLEELEDLWQTNKLSNLDLLN